MDEYGTARLAGADTHPVGTERLHAYWVHGKGAAKIRWGEGGDFARCTRQLMEEAHFTPEQAHGYCNLAHKAATGMYPAQHAAAEHKAGRATWALRWAAQWAQGAWRSDGD